MISINFFLPWDVNFSAEHFECLREETLVLKNWIAELNNWLPDFQFGFRKGTFSSAAVAVLVADINLAFGRSESLAALALDIKGAFNSIRPDRVLQKLGLLEAPAGLINFVGFFIIRRNLFFSLKSNISRVSGVGVPQWGALSPLLFIYYSNTIWRNQNVVGFYGVGSLTGEDTIYGHYPNNRNKGWRTPNNSWRSDYSIKRYVKIPGNHIGSRTSVACPHQCKHCQTRRLSRCSWLQGPWSFWCYTGEWGSLGGRVGPFKGADKVVRVTIRLALGCTNSTPLAILLFEAGIPHLELLRAETSSQYILRTFRWNNNPARKSIMELNKEVETFQNKKTILACGLINSLLGNNWTKKVLRICSWDVSWSVQSANEPGSFFKHIYGEPVPALHENLYWRHF